MASEPARMPAANRFGAPERDLLKSTSWVVSWWFRRTAPASWLTPDARRGDLPPAMSENRRARGYVTPISPADAKPTVSACRPQAPYPSREETGHTSRLGSEDHGYEPSNRHVRLSSSLLNVPFVSRVARKPPTALPTVIRPASSHRSPARSASPSARPVTVFPLPTV